MTRRHAACLVAGLTHYWRISGPLLLLLQLLVLLNTASYGDAQCKTEATTSDVNETSTPGYVIQNLDYSYQQSATPGIDPTYACYFEISGGAVRLKKQFDLENFTSCIDGSTMPMASIPSAITLTVPCNGTVDTATFLIRLVDINEFPPMFVPNSFRVNVSEDKLVGFLVIQLNSYVIDKDKSNQKTFSFAIISGSQGDFAMNDGVTSGIVRIQHELDYDAGPRQYVMNISASDLPLQVSSLPVPMTGYATLTIDIIDFDDKNPFFLQSSYSLYFMENDTSYVNTSLSTVPVLEARDGDVGINQTINYGIQSAIWSGSKGGFLGNNSFLSINPINGQLTVTSIIDREALPANNLLVQVKAYQTDKPDTRVTMALVIVTVGDKNDNTPLMSLAVYNVSIAENSMLGSYVTTVKASDADLAENATFAFSIADPSGAFQVDPNSGQVTVANALLLDREARSNFVMTVWARESLTPERYSSPISQLIVNLIDLNDNSPVFAPPNATYAFVVTSDTPVSAIVGSVVATDVDQGANGAIVFSVSWAGGGSDALFQLDPASGNVTTKTSLVSIPTSVYVMQVVAEDQALPLSTRRQARAIVQITVSNVVTTVAPTTAAATSSTTGVGTTTTTSEPATTTVASSTLTSTQTTAPSTTLSTTQPYSTTVAPVAAVGLSAVQIALIAICAVLLLLVIVLVALLIYCWKSRQLNVTLLNEAPNGTATRPHSAETAIAPAAAAVAALAAAEASEAAAVPMKEAVGSEELIEPPANGLSPSGLTLSRVMFEPAPYQSLTFSLIVPDLADDDDLLTIATDAFPTANAGSYSPVLRTAV